MAYTDKAKQDCAIVATDDMKYDASFIDGYNKGVEKGVEYAFRDMERQEEPHIGYWNDYDDGDFITFSELKSRVQADNKNPWTLAQYLDWRTATNLIRFNYDPFTGEKIDWQTLRKQIK